jgi:hypothetical protein
MWHGPIIVMHDIVVDMVSVSRIFVIMLYELFALVLGPCFILYPASPIRTGDRMSMFINHLYLI